MTSLDLELGIYIEFPFLGILHDSLDHFEMATSEETRIDHDLCAMFVCQLQVTTQRI